jgi:hypothetical protein
MQFILRGIFFGNFSVMIFLRGKRFFGGERPYFLGKFFFGGKTRDFFGQKSILRRVFLRDAVFKAILERGADRVLCNIIIL